MRPVPLMRRIAFQHCTSTLDLLGFDSDAVISGAGIPEFQYGDPMDLVPVHELQRAFEAGVAVTGNPLFGFTVGDNNPMRFGKFSGMITRSVSLHDALQNCARLVNLLNSESHIWVSNVPNVVLLCRSRPPSWQHEQYLLRHMVGVVQLAHGTSWRPREVFICSAQTNGLEDTDLFADTTFHFRHPFVAMAVPKNLLATELEFDMRNGGNETTTFLQETAGAHDFVGSIRQVVASVLPNGGANINTISEIVGIPKRSLQRELAREGETFRDVVGKVRFELARNLLENTDMYLKDIAHELDYNSETHLIRAFRRWAGLTPCQYRENH